MKWYLMKKKTPKDRQVVIIYIPDRPWLFSGKDDIHFKVAFYDKKNNFFKEFGPHRFLAEEVYMWGEFQKDFKEFCKNESTM